MEKGCSVASSNCESAEDAQQELSELKPKTPQPTQPPQLKPSTSQVRLEEQGVKEGVGVTETVNGTVTVTESMSKLREDVEDCVSSNSQHGFAVVLDDESSTETGVLETFEISSSNSLPTSTGASAASTVGVVVVPVDDSSSTDTLNGNENGRTRSAASEDHSVSASSMNNVFFNDNDNDNDNEPPVVCLINDEDDFDEEEIVEDDDGFDPCVCHGLLMQLSYLLQCDALLSCGKHRCNQRSHRPSQCPPCTNKSSQHCDCKREVKVVNCFEPKWKCNNVCGAAFACGLHSCDKLCHAGPCGGGECPLGVRSCPCGKSSKAGACSEVVETCGDTCQKLLSCGKHSCAQRCHRGACNLCLVRTKKKCRCGLHEKELPCSKEFTCETKCKQMRDCGKHGCNRKCCGDQCPPCEKICGKQLSCNKHKCQSVCHNGPCYPCKLESQVNCRCGKTRRSVPCGREKNARIACLELCRISAKCHHAIKHRCHKGECPPCGQPCGLPNDTSGCGHICKARCHAAIRVNKPGDAAARQRGNKYEYRALPHPRCEEGVSVTCIGGHEVATWPCWNSKPTSCQRKCARKLKCGNHSCALVCHAVPNLQDMQQQVGCGNCEQGCDIPRSPGCVHACARGCHPPPCAPCAFVIKSKCHCALNQIVYKCSEFFNEVGNVQEIAEHQEKLRSCGNRCLKNFACGHRCMTICHSGKCPNPELCRKKVRIYCACKRLKLEVACDKHRAGQTSLDCDGNCQAERAKAEATEQQQLEQRLREE